MNSGQVCAAGSRLFVHEKVFDQVVEGVVARAQKLNLGAGTEPATDLGPLVSDEQRRRVLATSSRDAPRARGFWLAEARWRATDISSSRPCSPKPPAP
jgi:acyl-CoA reductase-like NAD-dependent aldehyde dehydrogenase